MVRQTNLFPDLISPIVAKKNQRRSRFPDIDTPGERVRGRLRREARDFYPDGQPPLSTDAHRALQMLYAMCDYLDDAMADPVGVELLAVGGANVWLLGVVGFRISAELNGIAMLANRGGTPAEVEAEFSLSRPLGTIKPYQLMVECLYPALLPDGEPYPTVPIEDRLRDWLAYAAETLLKRDPTFRNLITRTLPAALRLPEPIHGLCLLLRARPKGPELDSLHAHAVIARQDVLARAAHECPKLMPLMMAFIDAKHPQLHSHDPIRQLKYAILKAGHSEAAWRYVCRYGARLFKVAWMLTPSQPAFEVASRYLGAMEAAGLPPPPPPSVAAAWLKAFNVNRLCESGIDIGEDFHRGMNPKILRLAFAEAHRRRHDPKLNEFIPEFLGVCWWSQQSKAKLDKNQLHTGWPWLVNQWKSEQSLQEVLATANSISWPMQLEVMSIGPWEVIPLNSSGALIRESFAMRNCLREYIVRCAAGVEEYYSVRDRDTGKREACFGFRFDELGNGLLIDVKGFANSKPLWEFRSLANQMQSRLNSTVKPGLKRSSTMTNGSVATTPEVAIEPVTTTDVLPCEAKDVASKTYVVMVDDNFHYMDESARWTFGSFTTLESAIQACKRLVDLCLGEYFEPGISAEKLLLQYKTFGDDPFIIGAGDGGKFSAWDYAALRCQVITGAVGEGQ